MTETNLHAAAAANIPFASTNKEMLILSTDTATIQLVAKFLARDAASFLSFGFASTRTALATAQAASGVLDNTAGLADLATGFVTTNAEDDWHWFVNDQVPGCPRRRLCRDDFRCRRGYGF